MEPDTNLYSQSENSEIIRENSQKILSVLAAHQIAFGNMIYLQESVPSRMTIFVH